MLLARKSANVVSTNSVMNNGSWRTWLKMGSRKWVHRSVFVAQFCATLGSIMVAVTPAAAQEGDGLVGRRLAASWCRGCHQIEGHERGTFAGPNFSDIANLPSTTPLALKVFLRTSHKNMPNVVLTDRQADDIVAYILSLKEK